MAEEATPKLGWLERAAKQAVKNLADATPLTRDGRAKGTATVAAELRGGLLDLQRVVTMAWPDSVEQATVLGMIGVPTPGMVDEGFEHEPERKQTRGRS